MTDEAATARKMAIDCEMLKVAYRQTKDGIVVSFLIHPQQVPDGLAVAALGTRYIVALVELGADETARPPKRKEVATKPRPDSTTHATGGARSWHEMSPAQQAGILCNEPAFIKFLGDDKTRRVRDRETAADYVRRFCGVSSRSGILPETEAAEHWKRLVSEYRAFMRAPEVV